MLGLCYFLQPFLQLGQVGTGLYWGARGSHCSGFSCGGAQAVGTQTSVAAALWLSSWGSQAGERWLRRCGAWTQPLHCMRNPPRPGNEPVSPVWSGKFLNTVSPGRSYDNTNFESSLFQYDEHNVISKKFKGMLLLRSCFCRIRLCATP